jgi:hypothetical protein
VEGEELEYMVFFAHKAIWIMMTRLLSSCLGLSDGFGSLEEK